MIDVGCARGSGEGERRAARGPAIVVIGASTGGPQALVALLSRVAPVLRHGSDAVPVCIALHMPRDLMPVIANHLANRCGIAASVVGEPRRLDGRQVYFAPGDRHLGFECRGDERWLAPVAAAARMRSAVDAMFASAATVFGARVLGIVLSGMGEDGLSGSRAIVEQGGTVIVQDRTSSAVWGMPGAVAGAGLASLVLPPAGLAGEVIGQIDGAKPAPAAPAFAARVEAPGADRWIGDVRR